MLTLPPFSSKALAELDETTDTTLSFDSISDGLDATLQCYDQDGNVLIVVHADTSPLRTPQRRQDPRCGTADSSLSGAFSVAHQLASGAKSCYRYAILGLFEQPVRRKQHHLPSEEERRTFHRMMHQLQKAQVEEMTAKHRHYPASTGSKPYPASQDCVRSVVFDDVTSVASEPCFIGDVNELSAPPKPLPKEHARPQLDLPIREGNTPTKINFWNSRPTTPLLEEEATSEALENLLQELQNEWAALHQDLKALDDSSTPSAMTEESMELPATSVLPTSPTARPSGIPRWDKSTKTPLRSKGHNRHSQRSQSTTSFQRNERSQHCPYIPKQEQDLIELEKQFKALPLPKFYQHLRAQHATRRQLLKPVQEEEENDGSRDDPDTQALQTTKFGMMSQAILASENEQRELDKVLNSLLN